MITFFTDQKKSSLILLEITMEYEFFKSKIYSSNFIFTFFMILLKASIYQMLYFEHVTDKNLLVYWEFKSSFEKRIIKFC